MKQTALLIVDFQNDYFSTFEGAKFELEKTENASNNASKILEFFRKSQGNIIHVKHESPKGAAFFEIGTQGAEIHRSVQPQNNEVVITKNFPNSFKDTNLKEILDEINIKSLIIVGAMSHMCIDATTRAAKDFGYECTVLSDATVTRDLLFGDIVVPAKYVHASFMAALEFAYARIKTTSEILEGL
ncbi:cysteine hydrolase family protein [Aliarcobacter lanthieri]|uniref:cysteine hydrolase family protein n=1 Tax=Aliarcobacter lanthieri TaxID=1355374 RepID=UPI000478BDF3|nr:cysteine hydrolase family protein [Aliarcobacter lanthieri]QKF58449.1 cysteine hydrolase [Aliarcobacter lanthieri]